MKQIIKIGMIIALSMAVANCSRDEVDQMKNNTKKSKDSNGGGNGSGGNGGSNQNKRSDILSGQSVPATDLGNKGDYYLNLSTYKLYGPKKDKEWGLPVTLQGITLDKISIGEGAPKPNIGKEGDWYINKTSNALYGPKTSTWEGGNGFTLGNGEYTLSTDKTTLVKWKNDRIFTLNMQSDSELKNITKIENIALAQMRFTSVTINRVTNIGNKAFYYNSQLMEITIPNSVTNIGKGAFANCKLKNVIYLMG